MSHKLIVFMLCLFVLLVAVAAPNQRYVAAGDPLPKPENIRCQGKAADTVIVKWTDNADDEDNYRVERRIGNGSWSQVATMSPDGDGKYSAYEETGVDTSSPNRYYRLRSYRSSDNSYSSYSDVCNNRRITTTDNFRFFYGVLGQDECPKIGDREACLTDDSASGENIYITLQKTAMEGSLDAFTRLGFGNDAGTPPSGLDKIPINVVWCDSGGCAGGGGLGLSPYLLEKPFDLVARTGDPIAWLVALHEAFHFQQYKYPGLDDPAGKWVYEGQARMIQDHICIGGNRSTAECFDDIDTGYAGYVPQVVGYLGNTNRPINETSYSAALFWTYLAEKYGTSATTDDVEAGMNLIIKFWEQANANQGYDGIYALNLALDELGHTETFRDIWKDFAVASYAKDLSGSVPARYLYDDVAQPGGAYGPPALSLGENLSLNEQLVDTDETVKQWGVVYYEVRPDADVPVIDVKFTQDTNHLLYYTVLGIQGNNLTYEHNVEARDLDHTVINNGYDKVVVVVAGLENMANFRYAFNGTQPTLQIVSPTTSNTARVGDPSAPDKFLVKIDVLDDDGVPMAGVDLENFSFQIGTQTVPNGNILTKATVQGQHWFVIRAVAQSNPGKYDLTVEYGTGALTDTESNAVDYSPRDEADNVVVLDRSFSMNDDNKMESAQNAAKLYVDSWHEGDQIGVVTFNQNVDVPLNLTNWTDEPAGGSRQDAFDAIDGVSPAGNTAIGDAVRAGWDELNDNGDTSHDWALVLLSDGLETAGTESFDDLISALDDTGDKHPMVHAVAVGPDADRLRMQRIAEVTGGTYQAVSTPSAVSAASTTVQTDDLQLDLDARYRMIATDLLGLQQTFSMVGPKDDGQPYSDVIDIPIEGSAAELILSLSYSGSTGLLKAPDLRDPNGDPVSIFQNNGRHYVWRVATPQQGTWTLTIAVNVPHAPETNEREEQRGGYIPPYLVQTSLRSDVTMDVYLTTPEEERTPGAPMGIVASLTDTGPISGASVVAIIENPNGALYDLSLYDDGLHGDGASGDGIYANTFYQTGHHGSYTADINAVGTSPLSGPFTREAILSFHMEGPDDTDGDGLPDAWEIRFGTDPLVPDAYADPDFDGLPNWQERFKGTNPNDSDTDDGGESDRTDGNPLDPFDDADFPILWAFAYPGDGEINLKYSWQGWDQVLFYRGLSEEGPFTYLTHSTSPDGVYNDTTVNNGTRYCYVVKALSGSDLTAPSPPTCATPKTDPMPPQGWVLINDGASKTYGPDVTLTLWASDAIDPHLEDEEFLPPEDSATGVQEMMISNYPDFRDATWEPYTTSKPWTLAKNSGLAAVYVKYRDAQNNESDVAVATINVESLFLPMITNH